MLDGTYHIDCSCGTPEDTVRFTLDKEEGNIYIELYNADHSLWRRIKKAIKRPNHWDSAIINRAEALKLKAMVDDFLDGTKNKSCHYCGTKMQ